MKRRFFPALKCIRAVLAFTKIGKVNYFIFPLWQASTVKSRQRDTDSHTQREGGIALKRRMKMWETDTVAAGLNHAGLHWHHAIQSERKRKERKRERERERERERKERGRERERGQVFQPPSLPLWLCFYLTTVSSSSSPQLALSYFCELFSLCFHFNHFKPFPLSDVLPRSIVSELQTDKCLIRQKKRPGKKDPGSSSFEESFRDF